jgi:hypothetical protein
MIAKKRKGMKTPIDPAMTGDIVEGPSGSSTGQNEFHENILSSAIIEDPLAACLFEVSSPKDTLNSSHSSMKQGKEHDVSCKLQRKTKKPKLISTSDSKMFRIIFKDIESIIMDSDDDDDNDDEIETKNEEEEDDDDEACQLCLMCFRLFSYHRHTWSIMQKNEVDTFIHKAWNPPPYQHIIEAILQQPNCVFIPVCQHCSNFVRKGLSIHEAHPSCLPENRPKHPVHMAVEFLLSGGCTPSPCHSVLNHLMESMAYNFPDNPILQMKGMVLHNVVHSVLHHIETFKVEPHTYMNFICLWKWVSTGSQRILANHHLAKLMRKYLCDFPHHEEWWKQKLPKSACRFCHGILPPSIPKPSFCSVIASSDATFQLSKVLKILENFEKRTSTVDHHTIFCCECCKFSVISYEYDCAFRNAINLPIIASADAYYTRMAHLHY